MAVDGLVFNVNANSSSNCGIEKKYNLFSHNGEMYFAGYSGRHIIRFEHDDNLWTMFEIDSATKENKKIGFFNTERKKLPEDITAIIGITLMNCYISGKNDSAPVLFGFTNVS